MIDRETLDEIVPRIVEGAQPGWCMKPPERFLPGDPREWMNRVRSNLVFTKSRVPGFYLEDLRFDAPQVTEKAIKALMLGHAIGFPYVHDLARLLSLFEKAGDAVQRPWEETT